MTDLDLLGRVALVTGSAKGLGASLALACAEAGARVAVHYYTSDAEAAATAQEARERGAPGAIAVQGDVTDPDAVDALFDEIEAELGAVDVLVNNVGDFAPQHWEEIDFDTWTRVLETNLNGTYLCTKRALPAMREAEWGRVVNVGYAGSEKALTHPKNLPYFIAKTGVIMFTRAVAADTTDDGITVNAVSPYVVESSDEFPDEAPRGRWAKFDDVRNAMTFFLTEEASYISGENIEIDGGWLPERL